MLFFIAAFVLTFFLVAVTAAGESEDVSASDIPQDEEGASAWLTADTPESADNTQSAANAAQSAKLRYTQLQYSELSVKDAYLELKNKSGTSKAESAQQISPSNAKSESGARSEKSISAAVSKAASGAQSSASSAGKNASSDKITSSNGGSKSQSAKSSDSDKNKKVSINVPFYSQNEEMPTGCELVSARMALAYYDVDVSYNDILRNLSRCELKVDKKGRLYGKSPYEAFIGNPKTDGGFGCYPQVIADMIDSMELENIRADDTSGLPLDFVAQTYIKQEFPVLVWVTIGMCDSYLTDEWYLTDEKGNITKEKYKWRAEEHCMVLVGYDDKYYYFNDPLSYGGVSKYSISLVEKRYNEVGCYSLVLRDD